MFRIDDIEARQKMEDIRAEVESSRQKSEFRKNSRRKHPPFWIVLITFLKQL